jgi:hypothetical protein
VGLAQPPEDLAWSNLRSFCKRAASLIDFDIFYISLYVSMWHPVIRDILPPLMILEGVNA